jgi:hypothetical protein
MMLAYMDRAAAAAEPEDAGEPAAVAAGCAAATDFGGLVSAMPAAVVRPASADDVANAIRAAALTAGLTVAARGNGHSVAGQATAEGGLVLDMRALALSRRPQMQLVGCPGGGGPCFADVPGGALWEEVLHWGVKTHGLAPASWTDYLRLTVGGTLSNGGVSGQSFRYGPQVSNVAELEVVTGNGECRVCSPSSHPDLFFAVLGGLGQFGVITRARIPLRRAPQQVRWARVVYASFAEYTADAEWLVTRPPDAAFDYVEGFAFVNSDDPVNGWPSVPIPGGARFDPALLPAGAGPVLYCLEVALYRYPDDEDKVGSSNWSPTPRAAHPRVLFRGRGCLPRRVIPPLDSVTGARPPALPRPAKLPHVRTAPAGQRATPRRAPDLPPLAAAGGARAIESAGRVQCGTAMTRSPRDHADRVFWRRPPRAIITTLALSPRSGSALAFRATHAPAPGGTAGAGIDCPGFCSYRSPIRPVRAPAVVTLIRS